LQQINDGLDIPDNNEKAFRELSEKKLIDEQAVITELGSMAIRPISR